MKFKKLLFLAALVAATASYGQTADEIISKYFENTGGAEKWKTVQAVKLTGKINNQGMELPITMVQLKDGRQYQSIVFQGKDIRQQVYDGSTLWSHNFMNMKAEKSDAEATENFKTNLGGEFPIPLWDYKSHGYKVELLGKETIDGTQTFKVKLTKKPIKVDGQPKDNVEFYYFDVENFVPLVVESEISAGPYKGKMGQTKLSDYQDVGSGLMYPFSIGQGVKGEQAGSPLTVTKIELNGKIDDKEFTFPTEK